MQNRHSDWALALFVSALIFSLFWSLSISGLVNAGDPVNVYESDTPIPQLLQQYAGSELLGRPTDNSITINVISPAGMEAFIQYGISSEIYSLNTAVTKSLNGDPLEFLLTNLSPNTIYYYKTNYKLIGNQEFKSNPEHTFVTQRPIGSAYTFDIQADPHMDSHSDATVYTRTLKTERNDHPDFLIDLGDTFMTEKFALTEEQVIRRYIETRAFFDTVGGSAPVFLVNGNHDGEFGWLFNTGNQSNDAYWAVKARKLYYPNPYPDGFYTGSQSQDSTVGLHENYFAWNWGNALFVVLDAYSYSSDFKKSGDLWDSTIGQEQYQWLQQTLEASNATYKFVFEHHILGEPRGMTTISNLYEWGGYSNNGNYEFSQKRPNWSLPIHQLLAKNNVTIFFQGHDHLFCKEQKDGVVYQEVPQPSAQTSADNPDASFAATYVGQVLASSGYLRVQVSPENVTVEYVKTGPIEAAGIPYTYCISANATSSFPSSTSTPNPTSTANPTIPPNPTVTPTATQTNPMPSPTINPPTPSISEIPIQVVLPIISVLTLSLLLVKSRKRLN